MPIQKKTLSYKNIIFFYSIVFLSNNAFAKINLPPQNYIETIRNIDFYSNQSNDRFANSLANEYKSYALYKAQFTPDFEKANYFATKALTAYHGERVVPDNIYTKNLPSNSIIEISNYYDDLLHLLNTTLPNQYPQLMAEAQVKFDCWTDSEANGISKAQSINCQNRFLKARTHLFEKLDKNCNKCKEEIKKTKITKKQKNFDGKYLPIPKWPNLPMIANNPPIPVIKETVIKKDIEIQENFKKLEAMVLKIDEQLKIIENDNKNTAQISAKINDINSLKETILSLQEKLHNLQETQPKDNTEQINKLKEDLAKISEKINNLNNNCPKTEEPNFNTIKEDEYIETEIFNAPSNLLPFEIFFDWNKSNVDYKFLPQLKDISEKALKSKEMIIIQGHTDSSGSPEYNDKLSKSRAEAVGKIIMSYGIPKEKITLQGVGASEPKILTPNGTKKPENRRVIIK